MEKVSAFQLWTVHSMYVFTSAIGFMIGPLAEAAKFDGAWAIIIAGLTGTLLSVLAVKFASRRPDRFFGFYGESIIGKIPHRVCMLLFCFFFMHSAAYILREFEDAMIQSYLIGTPNWALGAITIFCIFCLAQTGFAAIFHFAQGVFIFVMLLFLVKPVLLVRDANWSMLPAFLTNHDLKMLWHETYAIVPWYGELILFMFFIPFFRRGAKLTRGMWLATLAGTYILVSEFVVVIIMFGPELTARMSYPALEAARFIRLGDFLENLDPVIVLIWLSSLLVKITLLFYTAVTLLAQFFKSSETKLFAAPVAGFTLMLSVHMAKDTVELRYFFEHAWSTFALCIELLPLIYYAVDLIRNRRSGRKRVPRPSGP